VAMVASVTGGGRLLPWTQPVRSMGAGLTTT
jgi:hypothetical protein